MIKTVANPEIFRLSYNLRIDILRITRKFTKEERFCLTDQLTKSSRSISANIAEGWEIGCMKMNSKASNLCDGALEKQKYGCRLQRIMDIFS